MNLRLALVCSRQDWRRNPRHVGAEAYAFRHVESTPNASRRNEQHVSVHRTCLQNRFGRGEAPGGEHIPELTVGIALGDSTFHECPARSACTGAIEALHAG